MRTHGSAVAASGGALTAFAVGALLVFGRGETPREVVVLVLALVVVVAARFGGRAGGIAAALMGAAAFDFFHTQPYLSLKMDKADDIGATFGLLAVGLVAGGLSVRAARDRHIATDREVDADAVSRVLNVAGERPASDVELAARAELLTLLDLSDCWFTHDPVALPALGPNGSVAASHLVHRDHGFELPPNGVLIPVTARGERFGSLVCMPIPDIGVSLARRRAAVVIAHILGLALAATATSERGGNRG